MSVYPIVMSQGELMERELLQFPFEERGLQFGDGVYEVIRIYNGRFYLLHEHIERLFQSLNAIQISITQTNEDIISILEKLVIENDMTNDGIVYLQVTRGSAPRTHFFPEANEPNIYAYVKDVPRNTELIANGATTITHPDERWKNCYIKSLNLLPNVLAKQKAVEQNCYEAILYNKENIITEGSSCNIYLVKDEKIYTHPATNAILNGCVRMAVKRFSEKLNIPFIEERFTLSDIPQADELFLTSSISEIQPVVKVDETIINDGKRGKIAELLQHAYEQDAQISNEYKQSI